MPPPRAAPHHPKKKITRSMIRKRRYFIYFSFFWEIDIKKKIVLCQSLIIGNKNNTNDFCCFLDHINSWGKKKSIIPKIFSSKRNGRGSDDDLFKSDADRNCSGKSIILLNFSLLMIFSFIFISLFNLIAFYNLFWNWFGRSWEKIGRKEKSVHGCGSNNEEKLFRCIYVLGEIRQIFCALKSGQFNSIM